MVVHATTCLHIRLLASCNATVTMMMSGLDGLLTDLDQSLQLSLKHRSAIVPLPSLAGHELDLDTKLLHGAKPDEIKDLFAPRTGVLELPAELQGSQYARVRLPTPSAVPESRQRRRVATAQHQPELHVRGHSLCRLTVC